MTSKRLNEARARVELKRLRGAMEGKFEDRTQAQPAVTAGARLVRLDGQLFPAVGSDGSGAVVQVANVGRAASARYAPVRGDVTVSGGGSGGGLSTGAGGGLTQQQADALYVPLARQVVAGAGLQGGGALTADRTLSVNPAIAGAGLAFAAGILNVQATGGLQVASDALQLITPGSLSATSTNNAATNHTHAVTSAQDVSADTDTATQKRLLRADGGELKLRRLDVLLGGLVASSANYPHLFNVHTANENVGIGTANPDPQFLLDVAGPLRAQYLIGPHAIQLKDVLLLAHFDGPQPFERNFVGEPNGHMGQVGTPAGHVVYRAGQFGSKAVQLGAGVTNLCTNPSFEVDTTGWTLLNSSGSANAARTTFYCYTGDYAVRLTGSPTGANDFYYFRLAGVAASTAYTVSAWCYVRDFNGAAASNRGLAAYDLNSAPTLQATTITAATEGWVRHEVTVTTSASPGALEVRLYAPNGYIAWDSVQIEQRAYGTPYHDGSLTPASTWNGTAHASSSTRTAASLSYAPSGNVNTEGGTVMGWVLLGGRASGVSPTILRLPGGSSTNIMLRVIGGDGRLQGYWGNVAATSSLSDVVPAGVWTHVAMTYTPATATVRIYLNGRLVGTATTTTGFNTPGSAIAVGENGSGADYLNGMLDDLCITSKALNASQVLAIYESNAPVFAETSVWSFRATPDGLVWADERGLWVRTKAGLAAFGVYAGADASYTWGGVSLARGEVLMGRAPNYVRVRPDVPEIELAAVGGGLHINESSGMYFDAPAGAFSGTRAYGFRSDSNLVGALAAYSTETDRYVQIVSYGMDRVGRVDVRATHYAELRAITVGGGIENYVRLYAHPTVGTSSYITLVSPGPLNLEVLNVTSPDEDKRMVYGRAFMGAPASGGTADVAYWGHRDAASNEYAVRQDSARDTVLNGVQTVRVKINNGAGDHLSVSANSVNLPSVPLKLTELSAAPSTLLTAMAAGTEGCWYLINDTLTFAWKRSDGTLRYLKYGVNSGTTWELNGTAP